MSAEPSINVSPDATPPAPTTPPEAGPARPAISGVFGVLIIAQLLVLGLGCVVGVLYVAGPPQPGLIRKEVVAQMTGDPTFVIFALCATQAAVALALWKGPRAFETIPAGGMATRLGWSDEPIQWLDVLVVLAGTLACSPLVMVPLRLVRGPPTGALATFGKAATETSAAQFAVLVLVGAVGAGLLEELLFRGFTQRRLVERWGVGRGVVVTSMIFAIWHLDLEQGLYAFAVGLWLGFAAARTGSTVTVALAHVTNNLWSFVGHRLLDSQPDEVEPLAIPIGGVVLAASAWALWRLTAVRSSRRTLPG